MEVLERERERERERESYNLENGGDVYVTLD